MSSIDFDWGEGCSTGMSYDLRISRNRARVIGVLQRKQDDNLRSLRIDGVSCSVEEFVGYLRNPHSNFCRFDKRNS